MPQEELLTQHDDVALFLKTRVTGVVACRYSVEDSIEERMLALQEQKRDLMKASWGGWCWAGCWLAGQGGQGGGCMLAR